MMYTYWCCVILVPIYFSFKDRLQIYSIAFVFKCLNITSDLPKPTQRSYAIQSMLFCWRSLCNTHVYVYICTNTHTKLYAVHALCTGLVSSLSRCLFFRCFVLFVLFFLCCCCCCFFCNVSAAAVFFICRSSVCGNET